MSTGTTEAKQIPITEGLFTWPSDDPQLIGGTCLTCKSYFFPKHLATHKPGCRQENVQEVLLSNQGKLISYTWVYYSPPPPFKGPDPFVPFGVGMVELPEGIRVNGIITGAELKDLRAGMDMRVLIEKQYTDEEGNERLTWKLKPV